jgi:hypothetical protein
MSAPSASAISRATRRIVSVGSSVEPSARLTASRVSLARRQRHPLGLDALAVRDVAQDGEMTAGDEPGGGVVLDVPLLAVGPDDAQLAGLLARLEKAAPGGVDVDADHQELVEPTAAQLIARQAEQATSGGIGIDEGARVVDDEHGVPGRREESVGLEVRGHHTRATPAAPARQLVAGATLRR